MEEYTNRELCLLLKGLEEQIKNGFKGVHDRQDKTNGSVISNRLDIDRNKGYINRMIGALIISQVIVLPAILMLINKLF